VEGIRVVKQALPDLRTILGISNVRLDAARARARGEFGFFCTYCTKAGLDLAIVNTEKLERFGVDF